MVELKPGDVIQQTSWTAVHDGPPKARINYKAPKGVRGVFLLLGSVDEGEEPDPLAMLRALGWEPAAALTKETGE